MKISVVTAVWNRATTLSDAISSVQRQSYANVEHIIQDGGSTDGTLDIVSRMANDQTCLVSERDDGIYDAINRGIIRTTGDVVGLLHSDDFFAHDDVLSNVARAFDDPSVQAVFGDLDYVAADDTDRVIRHWRTGEVSRGKLARGWMPPHPTLYLRRSVFETYGMYDTSFRIAADYDAILRYFGLGGVTSAYLPEVMIKMRMGGVSNASFKHILRKSREDLTALRRNQVGGVGALAWKNLSKLGQFIQKG
jgi:glycosyltransferase involved in cell wall biosynthesis